MVRARNAPVPVVNFVGTGTLGGKGANGKRNAQARSADAVGVKAIM